MKLRFEEEKIDEIIMYPSVVSIGIKMKKLSGRGVLINESIAMNY